MFYFFHKLFIFFIVLTTLALCQTENSQRLRKRQVGVLARAGLLPQGKRSVEVLARNGELPVSNTAAKKNRSNDVTDLLIHELETAENLNRLNLEILTEMAKQVNADESNTSMKSSVSSQLHDSDLPQKRLSEYRRSGYLVKLPQEAVLSPTVDYFDLNNYSETHSKGSQFQTQGKSNFFRKIQEPFFDLSAAPSDHLQEDIVIDKRFLGRIPQLGRIHQRVQTPSSRRRPHLRPNWL